MTVMIITGTPPSQCQITALVYSPAKLPPTPTPSLLRVGWYKARLQPGY